MLEKPKWVREVADFFWKIVNKQLKNVNKFSKIEKKTATSQTHFGFTNIGSEMHNFRDTAIWNKQFRFGSPCITEILREINFAGKL